MARKTTPGGKGRKAASGKSTRKTPAAGKPAARKPATRKSASKPRAMAARATGGPTASRPIPAKPAATGVPDRSAATDTPAATEAPAATQAPKPPGSGAEAALPVFYSAPHPLSKERHGAYAIRREASYRFAARANSVPLNAAEFPLAARHYPIFFTGGEPAVGIALLGLRERRNLFIGAEGAWQGGAYVPAYIRRYPFIFMAAGEDGRYILCLDEAAEAVSPEGEGQALFENGEPSEVTTRALDFCKAYQQQAEYTRQFGALLARHGLLTANRANVTLKSGESLALGGFRMIDAKALDALDDAAFLELRRAGALPLIYAQIFSTSNWAALAARDAAAASA